MPFKVATVNILADVSRWEERSPLLVSGLAEVNPELIALQEVNLRVNTAAWLADKLDYPFIYSTPKTGRERKKEGIAVLSRQQFEKQADIDLQSQNRVAQYVQVRVGDNPLIFANGHFYWQPGDSTERLRQVERLLSELGAFFAELPVVVCGDFNAFPDTRAVERMRDDFISAYAGRHGREPEWTYPTPLPRSKAALLRTLFNYWRDIRLSELRLKRQGTLDYIFVNRCLRVLDCRLILDQPAPDDPKLYASDHLGLMAVLK